MTNKELENYMRETAETVNQLIYYLQKKVDEVYNKSDRIEEEYYQLELVRENKFGTPRSEEDNEYHIK